MKFMRNSKTTKEWLEDTETWVFYAKKCESAGQFIFSSYLYDRGLDSAALGAGLSTAA